jgi:hypothetical protein
MPTPEATKSASTRTTRSADAGASAKPADKATAPKKETGKGEQKKPDKEEKGKGKPGGKN